MAIGNHALHPVLSTVRKRGDRADFDKIVEKFKGATDASLDTLMSGDTPLYEV